MKAQLLHVSFFAGPKACKFVSQSQKLSGFQSLSCTISSLLRIPVQLSPLCNIPTLLNLPITNQTREFVYHNRQDE